MVIADGHLRNSCCSDVMIYKSDTQLNFLYTAASYLLFLSRLTQDIQTTERF